MALTRTQLVDAAEELNRVFEPPINIRAPVSTLKVEIRAASETLAESDQVSAATASVLRELNPEVKMTVIEGPEPPPEPASDEEDEEESGEEGKGEEDSGEASEPAAQSAPAPRERRAFRHTSRYEGSIAQRYDNALLHGGTWEEVVGLASTPERSVTKSQLKAHMRWRQDSGAFRFEESPDGIRMFRIENAEAAE